MDMGNKREGNRERERRRLGFGEVEGGIEKEERAGLRKREERRWMECKERKEGEEV